MATTLITLIVIFLLVLLWLDGARARELAIGVCKAACERERVQLLDGTVYLQRIGLRWTRGGVRFRRMFHFEFSQDHIRRQDGYLILIGTQLESIQVIPKGQVYEAEKPDTNTQEKSGADAKKNNVIPFDKNRK